VIENELKMKTADGYQQATHKGFLTKQGQYNLILKITIDINNNNLSQEVELKLGKLDILSLATLVCITLKINA
jgi:phage-related protein